ncbi:C45 family autoproteolytic acyltransferase/hydrolase [Kitasatospora sp. NPDC052896]|uniref:C45 family autoproteolytic acyltransferase/hydolase n=1 Tax=Kitasatospora sp. NPDC052896 TaxID=3364061 RepID=UPI0037C8C893
MSGGGSIPLVRVAGDPFTAGRLHGGALAAPLRAFVDDSLARLNRVLATPLSMTALLPTIAAYQAAVAAAAPDLAQEVRGLAEGAGISEPEAWLLQLRREIMGYQKVPTAGDCTTYARAGGPFAGHPVLAQTIDLNSDLDDQISVLEVSRTGGSRRSLVLSFAGLLGYLGLNSDGLAIGLNLVLGGDWRPGLPPYLAIRELLDSTSSVDQAVAALRGMRLASSRSLTLCDREKAVWVEVLGDELRVTEAVETLHTNHFLHPDLAPGDELNVFARNSSVRRLKAVEAGLAELGPAADPEQHFALLSEPPICVPDEGDIRRERTVAAVVMLPDRGELHVRPGDPSRSSTQVFSLRPT